MNRGGSWNNNARNCRVAYRNNNYPDNRNNNLGLRLAYSSDRIVDAIYMNTFSTRLAVCMQANMAMSRLTDYVLSRSLDGGFERCMVFCEVRHHVIPSFATSSELFLCNKSKSAVNRFGDSFHRIPSDQVIPLLYNKRMLAPF